MTINNDYYFLPSQEVEDFFKNEEYSVQDPLQFPLFSADKMDASHSLMNRISLGHASILTEQKNTAENTAQLMSPHFNLGPVVSQFAKNSFYNDGVCEGVAWSGMLATLERDTNSFNEKILKINDLFKEYAGEDEQGRINYVVLKLGQDPSMVEFIEKIKLLHFPQEHSHLFKKEQQPTCQRDPRCISALLSMVLSPNLKKAGGVNRITQFSGAYTSEDLVTLLNFLKRASDASGIKSPVGFLLSDTDHTVSISYDPINKNWVFIDSNKLPLVTVYSEEKLAEYIKNSFCEHFNDQHYIFNIDVYALKKDSAQFVDCMNYLWTNDHEFSSMHAVEHQLRALSGVEFSYWLLLSIQSHDLGLINRLLRCGTDPNLYTSLSIAVKQQSVEIVKLLLSYNVDIYEMCEGITPLHRAVITENIDVVKLLLEYGVHPMITDVRGKYPLQYALEQNNYEIEQILQEYGAII